MSTVFTAILYGLLMLLVFGVLVFIHELGHFLTARRFGVEIKEFAVGMGPTLFSWKSKKYDTKYGIRLLPIGGFVSMVGEDEDSANENAFCNKSVWKRMIIVVAGAVMNLTLGVLLVMLVVLLQGPIGSTTIAEFGEGALSSSQLMVGDEIVKVDGTRVYSGNEVLYEIMNKGHEPIDILVKRNGEKILLENVVFPTIEEENTLFGKMDFAVKAEERNFPNLIKQTFFRSVSSVKMIYDSLIGLVSGRFGIDAVSGPIGVAEAVGTAAKSGYLSFIYIVAILTINLGVVNLLPLPALDGGRFILLIIEGIRRKPLNRKVEGYINFFGMVVLFGFMILVSFKDLIKIFLR